MRIGAWLGWVRNHSSACFSTRIASMQERILKGGQPGGPVPEHFNQNLRRKERDLKGGQPGGP
ncbi:hypothetical protein K435DRAFT_781537 [Dendrothele bispora CBS 962.96]|uniref:Uncharacterized protein n=1 Tax=Dendrothele bispora (strain CBS 962.96) TaxID=1314807 RepID=A0A4S8LL09_DENBC|nr:hypothetical protein K435DRAFT_786536 [Dendrothele bispora CBS 962.96]THU89603.1 hypothetical protein K435DRAFT_781537 [Dendrothele bispora CBS 962.96]